MRRALALLIVIGCKDPPPIGEAGSTAIASTPATPSTTAPPPATTMHEPEVVVMPPSDAGIGACKVVSGPTKLSRPGPYALVSRPNAVDFYVSDRGTPALAGTIPVTRAAPTTSVGACAGAGTFVFCTSPAGEVRRFRAGNGHAELDKVIAHARPGSPISAAFASGHSVVGYLRDRMTSEGNMTEAWITSDDAPEMRLSDDGAGATSIALAARGSDALAIYVDARRAMTPVHARTIAFAPKLAFGKDAVLFVAGTAETYTRATLAVRDGKSAYALVPVAHDMAFGLATVKIDGEPATDAPITWSDYPNGLDPAPIGATSDSPTVTVARVRPFAAKFGSPRVLELGSIDASSAFQPYGVVPTQGSPIDVAIASDGAGGVVIAYTDSGGGFAERLTCPTK